MYEDDANDAQEYDELAEDLHPSNEFDNPRLYSPGGEKERAEIERRKTIEDNVHTVHQALEIIKHAGDARYHDHPMSALAELKDAEEALFAEYDAQIGLKGRGASLYYADVQSKVKDHIRNGYEPGNTWRKYDILHALDCVPVGACVRA